GSFPPNAFGLYDMHGNVDEWCQDIWHNSYEGLPTDGSAWESSESIELRVLCGGSWNDYPWWCRSADRDWDDTNICINNVGFRVICLSF
ncbi:formylglycine-generating enzyme family protein, partial [Okeania sp. SIO2B9]